MARNVSNVDEPNLSMTINMHVYTQVAYTQHGSKNMHPKKEKM